MELLNEYTKKHEVGGVKNNEFGFLDWILVMFLLVVVWFLMC